MTNAGLLRGIAGTPSGGLTTATEIAYGTYRPYGTPAFGATMSRSATGAWHETLQAPLFYNLRPSSCPNFKAALARAWGGGAPAHIVCHGDSLTSNNQGFASTYPGVLLAMLNAVGRYGTVRRGAIPVSTTTAVEGSSGNSMSFQSFTSWSWTPSYNVSKFTIYYLTQPASGGSTFTWALDGGATTTIDTSIGAASGISSFTVDAVTVASHTLALAKVGSNAVYVIGAEAWDDSIGYKMKITSNGTPGSASKRYTVSGATYTYSNNDPELAVAPDLMIVNFGANDQGVVANTKFNLISETIAAAANGADVIIMVPNTFFGLGATNNFFQQRQGYYEAADASGVPLFDVDRRWAELTAAQRSTFNADNHPSLTGLTDEARLASQMLYAIA